VFGPRERFTPQEIQLRLDFGGGAGGNCGSFKVERELAEQAESFMD
jgi:hypothetical protein